LNRSKKRRRKI